MLTGQRSIGVGTNWFVARGRIGWFTAHRPVHWTIAPPFGQFLKHMAGRGKGSSPGPVSVHRREPRTLGPPARSARRQQGRVWAASWLEPPVLSLELPHPLFLHHPTYPTLQSDHSQNREEKETQWASNYLGSYGFQDGTIELRWLWPEWRRWPLKPGLMTS